MTMSELILACQEAVFNPVKNRSVVPEGIQLELTSKPKPKKSVRIGDSKSPSGKVRRSAETPDGYTVTADFNRADVLAWALAAESATVI